MHTPFKLCQNCGGQNNLSAQFCQVCGARYNATSPPFTSPQPKQKPGLLFVCGAVVIVFLALGWIGSIMKKLKPAPSIESATVSYSPTPAISTSTTRVAADTSLADNLADNLAIVFAEAASRDAIGITAKSGTEIHVHIHDMKDFEFRRLQAGMVAGIRLWMSKHSAELSQTKVQKICVNNGPLMGLSVCETR
jgi:hypothetical protein